MSNLAWAILLVASTTATAALAQTAIPDLRGTWKGDSESIIIGPGNPHHHVATAAATPRLESIPFTLKIDKQDGRRISGTFSSALGSEQVIAVISRSGKIYLIDDDGYSMAELLAPDRMEICYMMQSPETHIASCTELIKTP